MNVPLEYYLLIISVLLLISIFASKTSGKLGVPALILFLVLGMIAGTEKLGGIYFDDAEMAQNLGVIALLFILFSGGLDTNFKNIKAVVGEGISLSTLGIIVTTLLVGLFVHFTLDFTLLEGMLLGAIVSSTDAAAVFSVLRARSINLKPRLRSVLELESGSNDPMAVFLTIGFISLILNDNFGVWQLVPMFFLQMSVGFFIGFIIAHLSLWFINRIHLEYEGLYPVLTISLILFTYSLTTTLYGNGFLAVYILGLYMGRKNFIHKVSLKRFHDGMAWLMQIAMFLTLGLLVFPEQILRIWDVGIWVALFLMLVARPLSVFVSLLFSRLSIKEKTLLSWVGLRGAVPIILATFALLAELEKANEIFNVVFFIVLTSTLLQGTTITLFARWLKVDAPFSKKERMPIELDSAHGINSELFEMEVPDTSHMAGKRIVELGLPKGTLIILIRRGKNYLTPSGSTHIDKGDKLLFLTEKSTKNLVKALVYRTM